MGAFAVERTSSATQTAASLPSTTSASSAAFPEDRAAVFAPSAASVVLRRDGTSSSGMGGASAAKLLGRGSASAAESFGRGSAAYVTGVAGLRRARTRAGRSKAAHAHWQSVRRVVSGCRRHACGRAIGLSTVLQNQGSALTNSGSADDNVLQASTSSAASLSFGTPFPPATGEDTAASGATSRACSAAHGLSAEGEGDRTYRSEEGARVQAAVPYVPLTVTTRRFDL